MKRKIDIELILLACLLALVIAFISCLSAVIQGCRSPYPTCTQRGAYRCNGYVIELCDGENWNPRIDCSEGKFEGDQPVAFECIQINDNATCEVIK